MKKFGTVCRGAGRFRGDDTDVVFRNTEVGAYDLVAENGGDYLVDDGHGDRDLVTFVVELGVIERYACTIGVDGWEIPRCWRGEVRDGESDAVAGEKDYELVPQSETEELVWAKEYVFERRKVVL